MNILFGLSCHRINLAIYYKFQIFRIWTQNGPSLTLPLPTYGRDAIFEIAREAGCLPKREVIGILDDCNENPADIMLTNWNNGKDMCIDMTIASPMTYILLLTLTCTHLPGIA
jgi:hypothetical protein